MWLWCYIFHLQYIKAKHLKRWGLHHVEMSSLLADLQEETRIEFTKWVVNQWVLNKTRKWQDEAMGITFSDREYWWHRPKWLLSAKLQKPSSVQRLYKLEYLRIIIKHDQLKENGYRERKMFPFFSLFKSIGLNSKFSCGSQKELTQPSLTTKLRIKSGLLEAGCVINELDHE